MQPNEDHHQTVACQMRTRVIERPKSNFPSLISLIQDFFYIWNLMTPRSLFWCIKYILIFGTQQPHSTFWCRLWSSKYKVQIWYNKKRGPQGHWVPNIKYIEWNAIRCYLYWLLLDGMEIIYTWRIKTRSVGHGDPNKMSNTWHKA